jgi:Peptidase family C54
MGEDFPFSIHNIAKEGAEMGRMPGDWYGPQAISVVLKKLCNMYNPV